MRNLETVFTITGGVLLLGLLSACAAPATSVPTPAATETMVPTTAPELSVNIRMNGTPAGRAQTELTPSVGPRVFIDISDTFSLSSEPTEDDILLITHLHYDHYDQQFEQPFPGKKLVVEEGEIRAEDVVVQGIASAHNETPSNEPDGTNIIYLIEIGGLRILHLGDIGQTAFTQKQLDALGEVDIVITQFANGYSGMSLDNRKGFLLVEQLKPKMVVPHHGSDNMDVVKEAIDGEKWEPYVATQLDGATVRLTDLSPDQTIFLIMGMNGQMAKTKYNLPEWAE